MGWLANLLGGCKHDKFNIQLRPEGGVSKLSCASCGKVLPLDYFDKQKGAAPKTPAVEGEKAAAARAPDEKGGQGSKAAPAQEPAKRSSAPGGDVDFVRFACTACGKTLKASRNHAGKKAKCSKCGQSVVIPGTKEAKAPVFSSTKPAAGGSKRRTCRTCGKEVIGDHEPAACPHCGTANPGWVHVMDKAKDPRVLQLLSAAGDRYARGQKREAVAEYLRAAELDPNEASIFSNIGAVYGELGETGEAIRYLKKALKLDPNLGPAQRMLRQMEEAEAKAAAAKPKPPPPSPARESTSSSGGSAPMHQCVKCYKRFETQAGGMAPLTNLLQGMFPGNFNMAQAVAFASSGMKCNRCGLWICADCASNAAMAAGAGMLQHTGCGGMFENP